METFLIALCVTSAFVTVTIKDLKVTLFSAVILFLNIFLLFITINENDIALSFAFVFILISIILCLLVYIFFKWFEHSSVKRTSKRMLFGVVIILINMGLLTLLVDSFYESFLVQNHYLKLSLSSMSKILVNTHFSILIIIAIGILTFLYFIKEIKMENKKQ